MGTANYADVVETLEADEDVKKLLSKCLVEQRGNIKAVSLTLMTMCQQFQAAGHSGTPVVSLLTRTLAAIQKTLPVAGRSSNTDLWPTSAAHTSTSYVSPAPLETSRAAALKTREQQKGRSQDPGKPSASLAVKLPAQGTYGNWTDEQRSQLLSQIKVCHALRSGSVPEKSLLACALEPIIATVAVAAAEAALHEADRAGRNAEDAASPEKKVVLKAEMRNMTDEE
eukprot:jgi/Mesen1/5420/ME000269S04552